MPLQPQTLSVALREGVDTKTDPKQVIPGKLITLENGILTTTGKVRKRNGYQALGTGIEGGGTVSAGAGLATFLNQQLLQFSGNTLYSYSPSTQNWTSKGSATSLELSVQEVIRNANQQTTADCAYHSRGIQVFTWEDSSGGSRYSVIDSTTQNTIVSNALISSTAIEPKPLAIGNFVVILFFDTSDNHIRFCAVPVANPTSLIAVADLAINPNTTNHPFDAVAYNNRIYIAYNNSDAGSGISLVYLNSQLTVSSSIDVTGESATAINITVDTVKSQLWVTYYNGTAVKYFVRDTALSSTVVLAPTVVETLSNVRNVATVASNGSGTTYYEVSASQSYNNYLRTNSLTLSTVGLPSTFIRSLGLAVKPFIYNGVTYVGAVYSSTLQPTYFILNGSAQVVCKVSIGTGGGLTARSMLPEMNQVSPGNYLFAYLEKDQLNTVSGQVYTQTGVKGASLSFTSQNTFLSCELGNNLHVSGGKLGLYDGSTFLSHGFDLVPESSSVASYAGMYTSITGTTTSGSQSITSVSSTVGLIVGMGITGTGMPTNATITAFTSNTITISANATATGSAVALTVIPAGTVTSGQKTISSVIGASNLAVGMNISGTGIPASTTITAFTSNTITISNNATSTTSGAGLTITGNLTNQTINYVHCFEWTDAQGNIHRSAPAIATAIAASNNGYAVLTIPTLRVTSKTGVRIVIYRWSTAAQNFYSITSITSPLYNDATVDTLTYVDVASDNSVLGNTLLYTTGNVADNTPTPAVSLVFPFQDRVILVPSEDRTSWWYSKPWVPGAPVEFGDLFTDKINSRGGAILAGCELDGNLILFTRTIPYLVQGPGPNAMGTGTAFPEAVPITTALTGCINQRSVVQVPGGIMRQTDKGIYLLDRALNDTYVGRDVEAYNSQTITSAKLVPGTTQVRFTLSSGVALVYDYGVVDPNTGLGQWSVFTNINAVDAAIFQQSTYVYLQASGLAMQETPGSYTDNGQFIKMRIVLSWLNFAGVQGFGRVRQMMLLGDYYSAHSLLVQLAYDFNPTFTQQNLIPAGTLLGTPAFGQDATYGSGPVYGGAPQDYEWEIDPQQQKCSSIQVSIEDVQTSNFGQGYSLSAIQFLVGIKQGLKKLPTSQRFG